MRTPVRKSFPRISYFLTSILLTLLIVPTILAQSQITTGQIQGLVQDANGAVVPGVNVAVKTLETNLVKTATTNEEGRYVALALPPGNYSRTVTKHRFATTVRPSAPLTVGQTLPANFALTVSDVAETITVTYTPTVDTVKTEI